MTVTRHESLSIYLKTMKLHPPLFTTHLYSTAIILSVLTEALPATTQAQRILLKNIEMKGKFQCSLFYAMEEPSNACALHRLLYHAMN